MQLSTSSLLATAILTLTAASAGAADCVPAPHHIARVLRHAPAHYVHHRDAGAEYAQSYYDYRSSSRVGEVVRVIYPGAGPGERRSASWRAVPDDVNIHFRRDRVSYHGAPLYPAYNEGPGYYGPPPGYDDEDGLEIEGQGFNGGVGYDEGAGGGGGGGGQAFVYGGQQGGQNEPSNGGGVNLPAGYGPDIHGNWQGPVPPHPAAAKK